MKTRLRTTERHEARHVVQVEMEAIEAEVVPIEAATAARQTEAEVKAAAVRLEATTPHHPRA